MKKRILFVISDTGGGHRSAANAIAAALTAAGADVLCEMVDLLRASGLPGIRNAPEIYAFFSAGHIWLHNLLFRISDNSRFMNIASRFLYSLARKQIHTVIKQFNPDLVVVIHPLAVRAMCAYRDEFRASWPVITVVTDLVSVHASWLSPSANQYFLPTAEAVGIARRHGISDSKIKLVRFPIHPRFLSQDPDRKTARCRLGLPLNRFTLLLASGGAGGGQIETLVRELEHKCPSCTLLVVTGRNATLYQKLTLPRLRSSNVYIYGFVDNMEQLMAACDLVITKAGPGTIMEAMVLRRPLILTGAVGLQEAGNIGFVMKEGAGFYCPTPRAVSKQVLLLQQNGQNSSHDSVLPLSAAASVADVLIAGNGWKQDST